MTDYTDLIARLRTRHPSLVTQSFIMSEAADAIAALTGEADRWRTALAAMKVLRDAAEAERDALQAHIAQEAEFLATVTAAKHEAEREVERLRDIAAIALDCWQSWVDDQLSGTSYYDEKRGEIDAVRSSITAKF